MVVGKMEMIWRRDRLIQEILYLNVGCESTRASLF